MFACWTWCSVALWAAARTRHFQIFSWMPDCAGGSSYLVVWTYPIIINRRNLGDNMISLTANRTNICTRPWWHLRYKVQNVLTSKAKKIFLKKSYREEKMANCSPVSSWSSHEREEQNHTLSPIRDLEMTDSGNGYGTYSPSPNQWTREVRSRTHGEKQTKKKKKKVLLQ